MLLRRIMSHIKQQSWFAISLDIVILIVGIFLGMQVTNWNDARKEQQQSIHIKHRIRTNLLEDVSGLEQRLVYWETATRFGEMGLQWLETGDQKDQSSWELLLALYQASNLWRFAPNNTTFEELRSAGQLGLIRDEILREDLTKYYQTIVTRRSDILYDYIPKYRLLIRGLIPYQVGRAIHEQCQSESPFNQALNACRPLLSDQQATDILTSIATNPELKPALRYWMNASRIGIDLAHFDLRSARSLADRLKSH